MVDAAGVEVAGGASLLLEVADHARDTSHCPPARTPLHASVLRVISAGPTNELRSRADAPSTAVVLRPGHLLIPGLVNAHAHLDLTHIGPRPHDPESGFLSFIDMVRTQRRVDDADVADSVRLGIELSLRGGVVAVGDIAGSVRGGASLAPLRTLRERGMAGVSFLEFFALGTREDDGLTGIRDALTRAGSEAQPGPPALTARVGLQPHAPYSVSPDAYQWAMTRAREAGLPIATHLAETPEERDFIARARGPMRELLEGLGIWDRRSSTQFGHGLSPVAHLLRHMPNDRAGPPALLVHVNDASDADIDLVAESGATVVYCPRASEYFGVASAFGPHRYRDMLRAGVRVVLGTDSIVNLPPRQASGPDARISVWDDMGVLARRDSTPAPTLLRMATADAARALDLDPGLFCFSSGNEVLGVVAVPLAPGVGHPLDRALRAAGAPELVASVSAPAGS